MPTFFVKHAGKEGEIVIDPFQQGELLRCLSVIDRLVILEPDAVEEIRDRGMIYLQMECFSQALEDLEAYLRLAPNADDAAEVREQAASLKKRRTEIH